MAASSQNSQRPGDANLSIGGFCAAASPNAIPENGVPRWHSRGYLPHFECNEGVQHVTFHLADSLPRAALQRLPGELLLAPVEKREAERRKRIDAWMDAGHGSCILRDPKIELDTLDDAAVAGKIDGAGGAVRADMFANGNDPARTVGVMNHHVIEFDGCAIDAKPCAEVF